jgi:hypothetical protein
MQSTILEQLSPADTKAVPEPLTILASAAALGSSGLLAKEYSKIKKKKKGEDSAE